jgi:predicted secreted protein
MTDALIGYLTKYQIWDAVESPAAFVDVAEVINVTPGEATADRIDATHMQSPNRRREYISGLIDSGEASFEINYVPGNATDERLRTLFESGDVVDHRIVFPNGVSVTYEASIIGFSKSIPIDDRMTATITVAVSGAETWGIVT